MTTSVPVSEAIRALLPAPDAEERAYPPAFRAIAEALLDRATLFAGGVPHRLTEVEFYYDGGGHLDEFTHGDPIQTATGLWYFHRTRGEYRSGTYKGLDITLGRSPARGGMLIRGVERLDGEATLLDGPSLFVDHVLRLTGHPSIPDLVSTFDLRVDAPETGTSPLHVTLDPGPGRGLPVYASARVGLSLKWGNLERRQRFFARPYRFLTEPARIKKGKVQIALSLHRQGLSAVEIAAITGTKLSVIDRYVELYERGKKRSPGEYRRDLSTADLCELLGACDAAAPME